MINPVGVHLRPSAGNSSPSSLPSSFQVSGLRSQVSLRSLALEVYDAAVLMDHQWSKLAALRDALREQLRTRPPDQRAAMIDNLAIRLSRYVSAASGAADLAISAEALASFLSTPSTPSTSSTPSTTPPTKGAPHATPGRPAHYYQHSR